MQGFYLFLKKTIKTPVEEVALRALMSASVLALVSKLPDPHPLRHHFFEITSSAGKNKKKSIQRGPLL